MVRFFVLAKPAAREIEYYDNQQPNQVNPKKVKAHIGRPEKERRVWSDYLVGMISWSKKQDNVKRSDQVKMQYIVKKRHVAINYQYVCKLVLNILNKR